MTRRRIEEKVEISQDKSSWQPTLLADQVVLVTTRNSQGEVQASRKSWLTMAASEPPTLALCCRLSHRTAINILETRQFVVNIPGEDIAARVLACEDTARASVESPETPPWTFIPSLRVAPPRVQECRGHIECSLDWSRRLGEEEMIFFGRIVAVSIDDSLRHGPAEERYRALRMLLYLDRDLFAVADSPRRIAP